MTGPPLRTACDECQLWRESLHVVRLLLKETVGDELREVGILVARLLEPCIQVRLHALPQCVTVGADDHGATHRAIVGKLGLPHDVQVPAGEVLALGRDGALRPARGSAAAATIQAPCAMPFLFSPAPQNTLF